MKKSLKNIFEFLIDNRIYNKELQTRYYSGIVKPQNSKTEKVVSLLYHIANTQSQPKIDNLAEFYKKIYMNTELLNSFSGFMSVIKSNGTEMANYSGLFNGMKNQNGWGDKTSALFAKTIFHLHNNEYPTELKIWNDAPTDLENNDSFYLPVDAVIIAIFKEINPKSWNFKNVNKVIKENYSGKDIEVWDDLWFWGFISQIGTRDGRKMGWNLNKYWTLRESDKRPKMIAEIKNKSEQFLRILHDSTLHNNVYKK
ncbi:hypothetical protein [uncultured Dokdonia sp.]|uniref:hypothetical protein n=1 Tax=uncultured Dokdonia sp. TaxID=575653 RepID=UPI00261EF1ED|nr:hypothetical protein [uncultured Dokdonia sp.]